MKLGIFTGSRAVEAKKCTKKRYARAKLYATIPLVQILFKSLYFDTELEFKKPFKVRQKWFYKLY